MKAAWWATGGALVLLGCAGGVSVPDAGAMADAGMEGCPMPPGGALATPPQGAGAVVDADEDIHVGCVLYGDGRLRCAGLGAHGLLGDGEAHSTTTRTPVVLPLDDVRAMEVSALSACALRGDGRVWCWGDNQTGSLHGALPRAILPPTPLPEVSGATSLVLGLSWQQGCAVMAGGRVRCWGGRGDESAVPDDEGRAVEVTLASGTGACVRFADDSARCNLTGGALTFAPGAAREIVAGLSSFCARGRDGDVRCWSRGGDTTPDVRLRCATSLTAVSSEGRCAARTDGTVWCWGGLGGMPAPVEGLDRVVRLVRQRSGMARHACAIRDDGALWCWGDGMLSAEPTTPQRPRRVDWR